MNSVLRILLQHQGEFISGAAIGQSVHLSRTAVWKHVQKLIEHGFKIDCIKKKGYRLHTLPENRWIPEKLSLLCHTSLEWFYKPEIDSTNLWAKEVMVRFIKPAIFFTDKQFAGRGRLGREWQSSLAKDVLFSLGLPLNIDICHYYQYTVMMAVAVHSVLQAMLGENVFIKWPNDIYVHNKKICGILSEMLTEENRLRVLIIGVGINVNSEDLLPTATSMKHIANQTFDRHIILSETLNKFFELLNHFEKEGFSLIYQDWKRHLMGIQQRVRIDTGQRIIEGILTDITEQGIAIIATPEKTEQIYSGDLFVTMA